MRILHISDTHLLSNRYTEIEYYIFDPLFQAMEKIKEEQSVDLICFTGDLIDKAGSGTSGGLIAEYNYFLEKFIKRLLDLFDLGRERFIIVPGNHDVVRDKINQILHPVLQERLKTSAAIYKGMKEQAKDLSLDGLGDFYSFRKNFYGGVPGFFDSDFGSAHILEVGEQKVGIAAINNSWRCYGDDDRGNLIVGRYQMDELGQHIKECDLKIALMHHPLDFLVESDKVDVETMLLRDYNMILTGHTHRTDSRKVTNNIGISTIHVVAPSNWTSNIKSSEDAFNGYTIIDLDIPNNKVICKHEKYSFSLNSFVANTEVGENGLVFFQLRDEINTNKITKFYDAVGIIESEFLPKIDQSLMTYNIDTVAPQNLDGIFVMPRIVKKESEYEMVPEIGHSTLKKEKSDRNMGIQEIIECEKDIILYGGKECGKTTLLNKIIKEILSNKSARQLIPVYIDQNAIKHNDIKREIRDFLDLKRKDLGDFLKGNRIILIIDNIRFNSSKGSFFANLMELTKENSNIKIISTMEESPGGELSIDVITNEHFNRFITASIKQFSRNEIQKLVYQWFDRQGLSSEYDTENIYRTFNYLNIPPTPLAVSMFVWILEKQNRGEEYYNPVNNAAMLENFIEKILEKHTPGNKIMRGNFDYTNKIDILTSITYEMFKLNEPNYRIEEIELEKYIVEYMGNNRLDMCVFGKELNFPRELISLFKEQGLFSTENISGIGYVKFKLRCFFEFFLMKNIDLRPEFKERVLDETNYLTFKNELDYYTGLARNKADILEKLIDRMESFFGKLEGSKFLLEKLSIHKDNPLKLNFDSEFLVQQDSSSYSKGELESGSDEEYDEFLDFYSEESTVIPNKIEQSKMSELQILDDAWAIVALVLRNTEFFYSEEYQDLKITAYKKVLRCALIFTLIHKELLDSLIGKDILHGEEIISIFRRFLIPAFQSRFFNLIGTTKLTSTLKCYMEEYISHDSASDVEKLVTLFLLMDLRDISYKDYFDKVVHKNLNWYMKDFVFVKLTTLYHSNVTSESMKNDINKRLNKLTNTEVRDPRISSKQRTVGNIEKERRKKELIKDATFVKK